MWQWRIQEHITDPSQVTGRSGGPGGRAQLGRAELISPQQRQPGRRHNRAGVVSRRRRRRLVHHQRL
jgi:hypothetical protein